MVEGWIYDIGGGSLIEQLGPICESPRFLPPPYKILSRTLLVISGFLISTETLGSFGFAILNTTFWRVILGFRLLFGLMSDSPERCMRVYTINFVGVCVFWKDLGVGRRVVCQNDITRVFLRHFDRVGCRRRRKKKKKGYTLLLCRKLISSKRNSEKRGFWGVAK